MKTDISNVIVGKRVSVHDLLQLENVMIIRHVHRWGGQLADRKLWQGVVNGEVEDWNTREQLIEYAESRGMSWIVIRYHKDGKVSCVQKSRKEKI